MMIGTLAYHAVDFADQPALLNELLEVVRPATGGRPLSGFRCIEAGSYSQSRWRKLTDANREQLRIDLLGRVLNAVHFDVARDARPDASCTLDLWVASQTHTQRSGPYPYNVKLIAPLLPAQVSDFVVASERLCALLNSPYGFVYPGASYDDVHMELTSIPSRVLGEQLTPRAELRLKWLGFWQQYEELIGQFVRTAYWGNFLGKQITDRLGGETAVLKNAPAAIAKASYGGGVYLQACAHIERAGECEQALVDLTRYLEPVSVASQHPEAAPPTIM